MATEHCAIHWERLKAAAEQYCAAVREIYCGEWDTLRSGAGARAINAGRILESRLADFAENPRDVRRAIKAALKSETWRKGGKEHAKALIREVVAAKRKRREKSLEIDERTPKIEE